MEHGRGSTTSLARSVSKTSAIISSWLGLLAEGDARNHDDQRNGRPAGSGMHDRQRDRQNRTVEPLDRPPPTKAVPPARHQATEGYSDTDSDSGFGNDDYAAAESRFQYPLASSSDGTNHGTNSDDSDEVHGSINQHAWNDGGQNHSVQHKHFNNYAKRLQSDPIRRAATSQRPKASSFTKSSSQRHEEAADSGIDSARVPRRFNTSETRAVAAASPTTRRNDGFTPPPPMERYASDSRANGNRSSVDNYGSLAGSGRLPTADGRQVREDGPPSDNRRQWPSAMSGQRASSTNLQNGPFSRAPGAESSAVSMRSLPASGQPKRSPTNPQRQAPQQQARGAAGRFTGGRPASRWIPAWSGRQPSRPCSCRAWPLLRAGGHLLQS